MQIFRRIGCWLRGLFSVCSGEAAVPLDKLRLREAQNESFRREEFDRLRTLR